MKILNRNLRQPVVEFLIIVAELHDPNFFHLLNAELNCSSFLEGVMEDLEAPAAQLLDALGGKRNEI